MTEISIIFPTYNEDKLLIKNLNSIKNLVNLDKIEVIIVDNYPYESKVKAIIQRFNNINIKLIELKNDSGYTRACNIGALKAKNNYLFFTNTDVIFPERFFVDLTNIFNKLEKNEESLILSSAVVFRDGKINYFGGKIHYTGISYTQEMYQNLPEVKKTFITQKASGCSLFIKKQKFIELNGFDTSFYMYKEDVDLSLRAIRKNIPIFVTNECILIHNKYKTNLSNTFYYYTERNRYLLVLKNFDGLKKLFPFIIIIEFVLLFQSILEKKLKTRLKIYKYLIQNRKNLYDKRFNKGNSIPKLKKYQLSTKLDPILLGNYRHYKIFRLFLKILNKIL